MSKEERIRKTTRNITPNCLYLKYSALLPSALNIWLSRNLKLLELSSTIKTHTSTTKQISICHQESAVLLRKKQNS